MSSWAWGLVATKRKFLPSLAALVRKLAAVFQRRSVFCRSMM